MTRIFRIQNHIQEVLFSFSSYFTKLYKLIYGGIETTDKTYSHFAILVLTLQSEEEPSAPPRKQILSCKGNAVITDSIFAKRSFLMHIRGTAPFPNVGNQRL
ncbi:MAG: hypothetical protein EOP00_36370 [Pedobacter sp.]|nr:MAG: hypothetical protein EOP00_36370 [Pedobacter sp.]